tara:strand:+ start:3258 stop:3584 length:327 start_codon:yes stop_codon:yes gene_type:complete
METRDKKTKKTLTKELLREIVKQTISEAYAEPGSDRWNRAFARARGTSEPSPEQSAPVGFTPEEENIILQAANILSKHLAFQPLSSALKHSISKMKMEEDLELQEDGN